MSLFSPAIDRFSSSASRHGLWRLAMLTLLGVALLAATACGSDDENDEPAAAAPTPTPTLEERESEILRQLRSMMQIETAFHSAETVIDVETEGGRLSRFFTGDRILLIAHGNVTAGLDMSELDDSSVEIISETRIHVTLPETRILSSTLDEDRTQVMDRDTGLFTGGDDELEAEAYQEAERLILESACTHNILQRAADEAETRITLLLQAMGFDDVTVVPRTGSCPA